MINSVSMSSMSLMTTSGVQKQSTDQEVFQIADTGNGGQVASAGGKPPAGGAAGSSSETEEVYDILDVNEDGYVSFEEMMGLTASQGYNSDGLFNSEDGSGIKPPPPPPPAAVSSAYEANSGESENSQLIEQLQSRSGSEDYSSLELVI